MMFGEELRKIRRIRQYEDPQFSLRYVAEQIGITPSYLSKIERGVVPPPNEEILNDLADLLQISHDFLYVLAGRIREEQIHNFHNLLIAIDKDANDFQLLNIIQSIRITRK